MQIENCNLASRPMPIKRATLMKLADMDRVEFDKCARLDQLPWAHIPETGGGVLRAEDGYAKPDPNIYTMRDAFQLVVAQDLARSYWTGSADAKRKTSDLAGASRIVASAWYRVEAAADILILDGAPNLWLFVLRSRPTGEGPDVEAPDVGFIGRLAGAIEEATAEGLDPSRILAVNLSASLRLLHARAAEHGVELPAGAGWIVNRI